MNQKSHILWVGLSFLAVGLTLGLLITNGSFGQANVANIQVNPNEGVQIQLPGAEPISVSADDDAFMGDEDAPITIVEFSDYQCPYCASFVQETLPLIKEKYIETGLVKFVYRDFPIGSHPKAGTAAEAAECVGENGDEAYFAYHDELFEDIGRWASADDESVELVAMAAELGYDIEACLSEGEMVEEVSLDYSAARTYGVSGTPTFFINGQKLVGAYPFEYFEALIEAEL